MIQKYLILSDKSDNEIPPKISTYENGRSLNRLKMSYATGLVIPPIYYGFTLVAYLFFPGYFNPITNWLSDLGDFNLNPSGFIIYNLGCIFTSILFMFCLVGAWELQRISSRAKFRKIEYTILMISGFITCISLILSGFFPINFGRIHSILSAIITIGLCYCSLFTALITLKENWVSKYFTPCGFVLSAICFVFGVFFQDIFIFEWLAIIPVVVYYGWFGFQIRRIYYIKKEGK